MSFGLGIDTGGTFTDAAIVELESGEILCKSKSPTTSEDLCIGIRGAISFLDRAFLSRINVVSLSSTLATNSVVEGKGCRVGLICAGFNAEGTDAEEYAYIQGGHNIHGSEERDLDVAAAESFMRKINGKVEAMAVSSFMSVRNPDHENILKRMVTEIMGVPVASGHELSSKLGFGVRTSTCVMNARLIPIMDSLIRSVKQVMSEFGIRAPLMIVRGNGTMMGEEMARERPIETIMSGPTASMIGGVKLTGQRDAVVMDMGGTTTDIGIIRGGRPALTPDGMTIAGKRTHVLAAKVTAAGIGGDSRILVNGGRAVVKSTKAIPLCFASEKWHSVIDSLIRAASADASPDPPYPEDMVFLESELFITVGFPKSGVYLSPESRSFLKLASKEPISASEGAAVIGTSTTMLGIRSLEAHGYIQRIAFTPTDVLHVDGTYVEYDRQASILGARYLARKCGKSPGMFVSHCRDLIKAKLCTELMKVLLSDELGDRPLDPYAADMILKAALGKSENFGCSIKLSMPIIGIGAPASTYIRWVGDAFGTSTFVDPNSDVGNAVGAVVSSISETVDVLISPENLDAPDSLFEVFSPEGKETCGSFEDALSLAESIGKRITRDRAERSGACGIAYDVVRSDKRIGARGADVLSECVITVTAAGMPSMFNAENL